MRWWVNHSDARRATAGRVPGSSNRWVAPGTTASSQGQRSAARAWRFRSSTTGSWLPTISNVGAVTWASRASARSGRPPRETIAAMSAARFRRGPQRGGSARTRPEQTHLGRLRLRLFPQPADGRAQPAGQQVHVEHHRPVVRLPRREEVEEQGAQARPVQRVGDEAVARAEPAAAAAVREDHDGPCVPREGQLTGKPHLVGGDRGLPPVRLAGGPRRRVPARRRGLVRRVAGARQTGRDVRFTGLREVRVELADPREVARCVRAHVHVGGVAECAGPVLRRHRHGHDHPGRAPSPYHLAGGPGGGAPVATPSSTRTTVRPAMSAGGGCPCGGRAACCSSTGPFACLGRGQLVGGHGHPRHSARLR